MANKEEILKKIEENGSEGITKSDLKKRFKKVTSEELDKIIEELLKEGKIEKNNRGRLFIKIEKLPLGKELPKYVSYEEFEKFKKEVYETIKKEVDAIKNRFSEIKNEIDRAYDYISDVFIYMKEEKGVKKDKPTVDDLRMIYDNLNAIYNFGDSVPVPIFKDEVMKKFNISEEEVDNLLLDLDSKEIIYLQTLDNPQDFSDSNRGIKFEGRVLYFITWMKKPY